MPNKKEHKTLQESKGNILKSMKIIYLTKLAIETN